MKQILITEFSLLMPFQSVTCRMNFFRQLICTLSTLHLTETYKNTSQRYIQKIVEGIRLLTQYRYNFSQNKMLWIMVVISSKLYFL